MFRAIVWGLVLLVPLPVARSGEEKKTDSKGAVKGLNLEAEVTTDDPKELGKNYKVHPFKMEQGKTYVIDMISLVGDPGKFNPFLIVKDSNGRLVAQDDDGGGFPNAQIVFTAYRQDTYKIVATTLRGGTGKYRLTVQPASGALAEFKSIQKDFQQEFAAKYQELYAKAYGEMAVPYLEKLEKFAAANKKGAAAKMAEQEMNNIVNILMQTRSPAVTKILRRMLDKTTDPAKKGQLSLQLAQGMRDTYETAYRAGEKDKATKIAAEAEDLLVGAKKAGGPLARQADDALFLFQKLSVGKVAPDIEGEDMEGKKFKLSDYRGKVVVIDYWAFW
jgi:hypothetical protein